MDRGFLEIRRSFFCVQTPNRLGRATTRNVNRQCTHGYGSQWDGPHRWLGSRGSAGKLTPEMCDFRPSSWEKFASAQKSDHKKPQNRYRVWDPAGYEPPAATILSCPARVQKAANDVNPADTAMGEMGEMGRKWCPAPPSSPCC